MSKLLLAVAIAIVAVAGPAAGEAFGDTYIVDADGRASAPANCGASAPAFSMIQPAVEASGPGDTVNVCPGTYPEQVFVQAGKSGLTLRSLVFRAAVIKAPLVMTDPGDIVTINGAQNVTLRDFTVAGPLPDALFCSLFHRTGVRVIGGGSAIIRGNHVTEIRSTSPALRGCINGFAIAVGRQSEGQTGRATIFDSQLDLYQKGGILVDNVGSSAEIRTNLVQGDGPTPPPNTAQNGIQISRGAVATIADNDIQDHTYSLAPATGGTGIFLSQAGATTTVSDNQAVRNDWNIFVGTTTGAQILRNVLLDSTFFDGIRMSATTSNNRIEDNFLRNNREHDCHDDSVGPNNPPAFVANLWINNDGLTENRQGLCRVGPPARLTLSPRTATNPVGTQHCVTATVTDLFGNPSPDIIVRFSVTGSVNTSGSSTTNASGQATFCYTGPPFPGADAIHAYADTNNSDDQDVGEPFDDATKTWVLPVSTPGCEVRITNGGWIIATNGDRSSFGGNARVDADGDVSGNEEYQDHGPAQPMNLHGNVLVVTCTSATQATIYGEATIDGSGSFFYRLTVEDNGEPGNADKYWMLVDNGYDSGNQTLMGGNIQIHDS